MKLDSWPSGCSSGCTVKPTPLYLNAGLKLSASPLPRKTPPHYDEYVSDPAKPVPFRARPWQPTGYSNGLTWPQWLVDDQREASGRTDVLTFESDVLKEPLKISGQPSRQSRRLHQRHRFRLGRQINRRLSRRSRRPARHGRLSADDCRGHLPRPLSRKLWKLPKPSPQTSRSSIASPCPPPTTSSCPAIASWCRSSPVGSRSTTATRRPSSPTSSGPKPADYRKATQRVYHSPTNATFIELPIVVAK